MSKNCLRREKDTHSGESERICKEGRGNKPEENMVEIIHELN